MAVAIVVLTKEPEFWEDKELLAAILGERAKDIELIRIHNFGIPIDKEEQNPVKVEFLETSKEE